jgi:hypothetical protein
MQGIAKLLCLFYLYISIMSVKLSKILIFLNFP